MNTTLVIFAAACCFVVILFVWRGNRHNNTRRRNKRGRDNSLEAMTAVEASSTTTESSELSDPVDEAEAYWGKSMPKGVAARELIEASALEPLLSAAAPSLSKAAEPVAPLAQASSEVASDAGNVEPSCSLGLHFLHWLAHRRFRLPDASGRYNDDDLLASIESLEQLSPSAFFPHGASLHRIGETCAVLFEPCLSAVSDFDTFQRKVKIATSGAQLYFVLGSPTEHEGEEHSAHIGPFLKAFALPAERFFLLQDDGSFHNHIEDQHNFVPARIDVEHLPESFLEKMLDYAQERYENGESEAALRVLGPLEEPLGTLALDGHFSPVLVARMLNLLGIAHREVGAPNLAVSCFMLAERLVKDPCEPDALQIVHSNLGETLALYAERTHENLKIAAHHLREAIRLDCEDFEAQKTLGIVYLDQYELTARSSLLDRAERVFCHALGLAHDDGITERLEFIAQLKERHSSLISLPVASPQNDVASFHSLNVAASAGGSSRKR